MTSPAITSQRSQLSRRRARAGFSLIEMVIVVGIIVLLFALTIGVITVLNRGSESRRTQDAIMLLDSAYAEWKRQADRDISYGDDGTPPAAQYEVQMGVVDNPPGTGDDHEPTDELIEFVHRNTQAREQLSRIHPDLLKPHSGSNADITMIDAWGTEIITVLPGRPWVQGFDAPADRDIDGTIKTPFEKVFGICLDRRARFVSAGPDGLFGDLSAASSSALYEALKDNIYSYPLENAP
jgi:prepilin-type N-terminal cleavage/methylation domain-containing protein